MANISNTIKSITLKEEIERSGLIARDCDIALRDLARSSYFQPINDTNGPYTVEFFTEDGRLILHIQNAIQQDLPYLVLSLKPYKRLIKDYFLIVTSYNEAIKGANPSRIEAIDMGRRGLHNEGAELLMERLSDKVKLDLETARRLFTLICVLHSGKAHTLR